MSRHCQQGGNSRGFTVPELIFSVALVAILLTAAQPSFKSLMASTQVRTAKNLLVLGLQRARAEAVKTGRNLVLCPSEDEQSCSDNSDWSAGWVLFRDDNRNSRFDPTESLILAQTLDSQQLIVHSTSGRRRITYRSLGDSEGANVTFVVCSRRDLQQAGQVIVANSGRVRTLNFAPPDRCAG
jgi:type IV fimbrial biogenesis protein FimT